MSGVAKGDETVESSRQDRGRMVEVARTNDPVLLSFARSVLGDAGIASVVADHNMSVIEGSLRMWRQRILVAEDDLDSAREVLALAELPLGVE